MASILLMAARLFASKPLHATAFQRISLILSQILNNPDLILKSCREILATIQPLISNTYHSQWVIQPLLFIIKALKCNENTRNESDHQEILVKAAYSLDSALVTLYQERRLSQYIMNSVLDLPVNNWRTSFLLFAAKNQILDSSIGNEQTLPLYAAELFRISPEKSCRQLLLHCCL